MELSFSTKKSLAIAVIIVLGISIRLVEWRGFGAVDDAEYARFAYALSTGSFPVLDYSGPPVFPLRMGIILPTALLFKAFGVHEWTMVGFPFSISVLCIFLAYGAGNFFFGVKAGLMGALIWAVLPIDGFHASILVPDPAAAFFAGFGIVLLIYLLYRPWKRKLLACCGGYTTGLLFGYSWLCKESLIYLFPFVLILFLWSLQEDTKMRLIIWIAATSGLATVLIAEMLFYQAITGDLLFRLHAVERNILENPTAFDIGSGSHLKGILKRIVLTGPLTILANTNYLLMPLFALLGGIHAVYWKDRSFRLPVIWLLLLALMFNFGSVSLKRYLPLLLFERYLYPLFLPAVIIASGFLTKLWFASSRPRDSDEEGVIKERTFWALLISVFIVFGAVYKNYQNVTWCPNWKTAVSSASRLITPHDRVYTDILSIHGLEFFWQYPGTNQTISFEDIESISDIKAGSYVLINETYLDWLRRKSGWWPNLSGHVNQMDFSTGPVEHWQLVWQGDGAKLYQTMRPE